MQHITKDELIKIISKIPDDDKIIRFSVATSSGNHVHDWVAGPIEKAEVVQRIDKVERGASVTGINLRNF